MQVPGKMVIHLRICFCFLLSLSILLPTAQGDEERGLDTGMCTGLFWELGRPLPGTKCAKYQGTVCRQYSGRWGKSSCYIDTKGSNWGAECVKCSGTQFGSIFNGPATKGEEVINFQPETGILGKYVLVKRKGKGIITFAEVQVNPESLGLRCNGMNEGCCTRNNPCGNGDGDCDSDSECEGDLVCGYDNCPWKDGDSCCKKPRPGKPTMSSEYSSTYSAKKCMDEKRDTYCYNKKGGDENPYFMIEYTKPVMVNKVRLIAAKKYPQHAKNIKVIVTNDINGSGTQFGSIFKGPATKGEEVINFQPKTGIMGKYVIVKKQEEGVITFAEVEVNPEN